MNDAAVIVRRVFPASRERLFKAWSDPKELVQWFSRDGWHNPSAEADVRPGHACGVSFDNLVVSSVRSVP